MTETYIDLHDADDVAAFCYRNNLSKATYYRLKKVGRGPRTIQLGKKEIISRDAGRKWRKKMEDENSTES